MQNYIFYVSPIENFKYSLVLLFISEYKVLKYVRSCYFGDVNDTKIGCRMDPSMMDYQDVQCFVCDNENFCNNALGFKIINQQPFTKYLTLFTLILITKILIWIILFVKFINFFSLSSYCN